MLAIAMRVHWITLRKGEIFATLPFRLMNSEKHERVAQYDREDIIRMPSFSD
jgi:hypothetical protein